MKNKKVRIRLGVLLTLTALSIGGCGLEQSDASASATTESTESTEISNATEVINGNVGDMVSTDEQESVQMVRPIQVSYPQYDGSVIYEYYDEDGDIIKKTDGTVKEETYTYLTDELGNKVYAWSAYDLFSLDYGNHWSWYGKLPCTEAWAHNLLTKSESVYFDSMYSGYGGATQYNYDENHRMVVYESANISYVNEEDGLLLRYNDVSDSDYVLTGEAKLNQDGYLETLSFKSGNLYQWNQEFEYDENKNIITYTDSCVKKDDWSREHSSTTVISTYTYDDKGNMLTEQRMSTRCEYDYSSGIETGKTVESERMEYDGYDVYGNYTIKKYYENEEMKEAYFYEYDASGKLLKESMLAGSEERIVEFKYDEQGRLSQVCIDGAVAIEFLFDEEGRLEKVASEKYETTEYESEKYILSSSPLREDIELQVDKLVKEYTGLSLYTQGYYFSRVLTFTYE